MEDAYDLRGGCGLTDGDGCSPGVSEGSLFGGRNKTLIIPAEAF